MPFYKCSRGQRALCVKCSNTNGHARLFKVCIRHALSDSWFAVCVFCSYVYGRGWLKWVRTLSAEPSTLMCQGWAVTTTPEWWTMMARLCSEIQVVNSDPQYTSWELWSWGPSRLHKMPQWATGGPSKMSLTHRTRCCVVKVPPRSIRTILIKHL